MAELVDKKNGFRYVDVGNARLTFVPAKSRAGGALRIQAYKGKGDALHMGAEIPLSSTVTAFELIAAICKLCSVHAACAKSDWDCRSF